MFSAADFASAMAASVLIPHRAVYEVSLKRVSEMDGVRGAHGTMAFSISDHCDGYTLEQTTALDMAFASGVFNDIEQRYASWESKDGRSSTFRMEFVENGKLGRSHRGRIELEEDGSGEISIESDGTAKFELPAGTMLSTTHMIALLEKAEEGSHFLSAPVIDGSFDDGAYRVSAVIGNKLPETEALSKQDNVHDVARGPYWPVSTAYFQYGSEEEEVPLREVSFGLAAGGIVQSMTQEFVEYSLGYELVYAEPLEFAECPGDSR